MRPDPDIELMLRLQAGDDEAFGRLFRRWRRRVVGFCLKYCGRQAVAEELAQEIFFRVYRAAGRYKPQARFRTWLFTIAARVCLNELRRPVYRARLEPLDADPPDGGAAEPAAPDHLRPDCMAQARSRHEQVAAALERLTGEQRAALLLRADQGFSYRQIAGQLGCSEAKVKTLIHRARKALAAALAAEKEDAP